MAKTPEQLDKLYALIAADPVLAEHGRKGRDADIRAALAAVRDDINVPRGRVSPCELDGLIDPGERSELLPSQLQQLSTLTVMPEVDMQSPSIDWLTNSVLSAVLEPKSWRAVIAHRTKKGSIIDRDFGGDLTVSDVSDALKRDRPEGKIK